MHTHPEQNPKERLKVVHKGGSLAVERVDGHERPRTGLACRDKPPTLTARRQRRGSVMCVGEHGRGSGNLKEG
jgi:hypothetical protein